MIDENGVEYLEVSPSIFYCPEKKVYFGCTLETEEVNYLENSYLMFNDKGGNLEAIWRIIWTSANNDWDIFAEVYKPIDNPCVKGDDQEENIRFEIWDDNSMLYVKDVNEKTPNKVWTQIEGDDGNYYIVAGYQHTDRICYYITEREWVDENEIFEDF